MALLDTAHRVSRDRTRSSGSIHPSVCVAAGFGFIIASALAVHVIFNALI